jgi:hypothetical protein
MNKRWIGGQNFLNGRTNSAIESAHAFAVLDEMKFKPEDIVSSTFLDVATKI